MAHRTESRNARAVKWVGRIYVGGSPRRKRQPKPCANGWHVGPLLDREKFAAAGGMWAHMGNCAECMSTIHESQLRRSA